MNQPLKKTLHLKVKQPDLRSLRNLSSKMAPWLRESFTAKYGNLLDLLTIKVQGDALTALGQYYDPPLRCFTFQDYQLAPTLEEFDNILCFPPGNRRPYRYVENYCLAEKLSEILKVPIPDLAKKIIQKGDVEGLTKGYLENEASFWASKEKWAIFMDIFALIIYGIVLFPNVSNFIDYAAIDVFLAFKLREQNPASVILADVYYTLHERHERRSGLITCCLPVLYRWFTSHIFKRNHMIEAKSQTEWSQYVAGLKGNDISWYSRDQNIEEFVYQCGDFPNVPLIGTKGCINYNPAIALRQFGYPMMNPPSEESLFPSVLEKRSFEDPHMLRKIGRAWGQISKKGRELGPRSVDAKESYIQWVKLRVQKIGLPFRPAVPVNPEIPPPTLVLDEDLEKLQAALSKSDQEKTELQAKLEKVLQENADLQRENVLKRKRLAECEEKEHAGKEKIRRIQEGLRGANEELKVRNRERDRAIDNAYTWEKQLTKSVAIESALREQLEGMRSQLEKMTAESEERLVVERKARDLIQKKLEEYQEALQEEYKRTVDLKTFADYQDKVYDDLNKDHVFLKEHYMKLNDECEYQKSRFSRLAEIANEAVREVPRRLRAADFARDEDTPVEITRFIDFCKRLVTVLKVKSRYPGFMEKNVVYQVA